MKLQVGVKALIQNKQKQYLFVRRSQTFHEEVEPHWDIPGGRIDPEEALLDALQREIMEETGLRLEGTPKLLAAQDIFVTQADLHVVRLTYHLLGYGNPHLSDEHQEARWMSAGDALSTNIDPYIQEVLQRQEKST